MQMLSRRLYTAARSRNYLSSSRCPSLPIIPAFSASNACLHASNSRFLSTPSISPKPLKISRLTRPEAKKLHVSNAPKSAHEIPIYTTLQKQKTVKKLRLNVHRYVVQQEMPLKDVFPLLQKELQVKTLKNSMTRQALDSFYFYCAQEAEKIGLLEEFRRQVLDYFDQELFLDQEEDKMKLFVLGKSLNEAVFGSVIKLHLAGGDTEAAWRLINKLKHAVKKNVAVKLHFRTVSPLLEYECRHDQFLSAYSRWEQLKQHDVEWTTAMEDVLVQMVIACVKHNNQELKDYNEMPEIEQRESHFHAQMTSLLHDLQLTCREVSPPNAQRLVHAFRDAKYIVETVSSDAQMRSQCPCCGHALKKPGMSELERQHMLTAIESRRSKVPPENAVKEYLNPFRDWLMLRHENFQLQHLAEDEKNGKLLHYVLDGPNIAYINQNFGAGTYRLDQVDAVAKELQAQGHLVSITMPAAYLANKFVVRLRTKHFKEMRRQGKFVTRERTLEEKAIMARWQDADMIFSCRTDFLSDDLFWLYASVLMGEEGRVVTNDQGRDHVFALLNGYNSTSANARTQKNGKKSAVEMSKDADVPSISMDLIARWKDMTTVNIEIEHDEVAYAAGNDSTALMPVESIRLLHPQPFSRVPQVTAPQHFHFPIVDQANQNEHPNQVQNQRKRTRWLCAHLETMD